MADEIQRRNRHIILNQFAKAEPFKKPQPPIAKKPLPNRDRRAHGKALLGHVKALEPEMEEACSAQKDAGMDGGFGLSVDFEGFHDVEMAFESLSRENQGIELLNVRQDDRRTHATVFVPDGKLSHFEKLIQDYLEERRDKAGKPRDHKTLIESVQAIRKATVKALWTDDPLVFPTTDEEVIWWEVWLPVRQNRETTVSSFRRLAEAQGFRLALGELVFPERTVLLVYGSKGLMQRSMMMLNSIAELRRAKETAEFFDSQPSQEQQLWLQELVNRTTFSGPDSSLPHVCLLDTGINRGHPLLAPALAAGDMHTVEPAWGTDDTHGHGTNMAGLAIMGDLVDAFDTSAPLSVGHRLESVKLLPDDGGNAGDARHHGYLTTEAVMRPAITDAHRPRVFGMAVTAKDYRDRGRPSAWSAALDRLASDSEMDGDTPRLLVVSAGNIQDPSRWAEYPRSNSVEGIHDPGQAWNALTVGAFTDLVKITEPDADEYRPIASAGGLSPFSSTSRTWQPAWPLKPDVVFEGGNVAKDAYGACWMSSLSLLTTHHVPHEALFTTTNATSAATALGARMAAQLMKAYPELWPEAIRALIVHSARWTPDMRRMFLSRSGPPKKDDYENLVRHCGFGVPDLDRALWSVSNSLTLVAQDRLHPFKRDGSKQPKLRDMHLFHLPWPLEELEMLGATQAEMRVTLSYFIEPNPSERGFRSRYNYESHGLRFDVKRAWESEEEFRARINVAARDEEEGTRRSRDDGQRWAIGKRNRHRGSIHSDLWSGEAADLASCGVIAVYPTVGWWRNRPRLERYNNAARYSLIVSIHAPEVDVDLYTPVANQITTPVMVES